MRELALVVPFPNLVEQVGLESDLPPHVTLLYPCPDDMTGIGEALTPFEAFEVTFPRFDRFPGTLWLAPEPTEPFVRMTEALVDRFPGHPPYGGAFDTIVPHLSVAQAELDETEHRLEPLLPLRARADAAVLYEHAAADRWREVRAFSL